jgi:hypothetical protein
MLGSLQERVQCWQMTADGPETPLSGEDEDPEFKSSRVSIPPADLLISLALLLATLTAYVSVVRFGGINVDDTQYLGDVHARAELTARSLKWIFLSFDPDNWFPLTRLSLLIDYNLFGPDVTTRKIC